MSSLSQLSLVRPCSNLHPTHIKDQHLTRPTTLRASSFTRHVSTKRRNPRFVPRITCTNVSKGDDDNRPSKLLQTLFNNINDINISKGEDENQPRNPLQTVFNNVGNKNIYQLSELVNGTMSVTKILAIVLTRKLLLQLFSSFTAFLINHVEFTLKPMRPNGTDVGIKWYFDWKGLQVPLGKECSLNIAHVYSGKLYVRKANILANILVEPFLHIKPIMSKLKENAMPLLDAITSHSVYLYGLSSLVFMAISLILLQKTFG